MSQLPLYHKRPHRRSIPRIREAKEVYLIMFLLVTFSLAWCVLVVYIPESLTTDTNFQATYQKFSEGSFPPGYELPPPPSLQTTRRPETNKEEEKLFEPLNVPSEQDPQPSKEEDKVLAPSDSVDQPLYGHSLEDEEISQDDEVVEERREVVKQMIKHAWDGYVQYAFGENELKPISMTGHSAAIFGKTKVGATLVDSLDTLYIAGLTDEFNKAKEWVDHSFNINEIDSPVSFFEFNIRFIGGLLSAYALSGDEVFKYKAVSLADKMMPVFNPDTGLPSSFINIKTGKPKNWGWAKSSSVLSEVGSLHLEYQYLSEITDNTIYLEKVNRVREIIKDIPKSNGLYFTLINQQSLKFSNRVSSLGALGDSFYEYLLKSWLITSKDDVDARDLFYSSIDALEDKMLLHKPDGAIMVTDYKGSKSDRTMQHLACFSGGMYGLASVHAVNGKGKHYLSLGKNITYACRRSYDNTPTKLGPERFRVSDSGTYSSSGSSDKVYLLRPETVESYFYMWRLTHDQKYRDWGWDVVQAIEKYCKTPHGYSGLRDVYSESPVKDDVQQSFFIAETLKYLYLLFSDDNTISLDDWVVNTEAHPLPVLSGIPKSLQKVINTEENRL